MNSNFTIITIIIITIPSVNYLDRVSVLIASEGIKCFELKARGWNDQLLFIVIRCGYEFGISKALALY